MTDDDDFDDLEPYEDEDFEEGLTTVTLTQRYLGWRPYILVELEDNGEMELTADGGTREQMVHMSKQLSRLGREMRKQYKKREKENN